VITVLAAVICFVLGAHAGARWAGAGIMQQAIKVLEPDELIVFVGFMEKIHGGIYGD